MGSNFQWATKLTDDSYLKKIHRWQSKTKIEPKRLSEACVVIGDTQTKLLPYASPKTQSVYKPTHKNITFLQ